MSSEQYKQAFGGNAERGRQVKASFDTQQESGSTTEQTGVDWITIEGNPDFGYVLCQLPPNKHLWVEGGAMATMASGMEVKSKLVGGFFSALIRKIFGGESLFVGDYHHPSGGELAISPAVPGRVCHRKMAGETIFLQSGAFMACEPEVTLGTQFGGLRALFSGEGAFFLKCSGRGSLFFNAYGNVIEKEITGEPYVVDTGHVVGWESTVNWKIRGMGSLFSTLFSGEGLVIEFSGRGKIWVQTRTGGGFAGFVSGYCR